MDDETDLMIAASRLKRDSSMLLLVNESHKSIQQLALLSELEKRAVASLVLAGQLVAVYSRSVQPDREVLAGFEQMLSSLSPVMASHAHNLSFHAMAGKKNATTDSLSESSELTHDIGILIESLGKVDGKAKVVHGFKT